jgi:hypothetical protein
MSRFFGIILLMGIVLCGAGAYEFFIQAGTSREPTRVTIEELERDAPSNRHLIVTGGQAMLEDAVSYYETRSATKVASSEIHYIPIQDATLAAYDSFAPRLLVLVTEYQVKSFETGKAFDANSIQGVRMTSFELKTKAEEFLTNKYGESAVKRMVILDYERAVTGVGKGLSQMIFGAILVVGAIVLPKKMDSWNLRDPLGYGKNRM